MKVISMRYWPVLLSLVMLFGADTAKAREVLYIHTDALGSPVAYTDANANVVKRVAYEPYGAVTECLDDEAAPDSEKSSSLDGQRRRRSRAIQKRQDQPRNNRNLAAYVYCWRGQ